MQRTTSPLFPTMLPLLVYAFFFLALPAGTARAEEQGGGIDDPAMLTYMTEEYYPYNFTRNGTAAGISVDMLHTVWNWMGVPAQPIHFYPWARGYMLVRREPGTVLFSMARTPEREHMFKWAGPISTVRFVLISLAAGDITLNSMEDITGLSVGTVRDDITDLLMNPYRNSTRIEPAPDIETNFRKLLRGRLDLMAYEERSFARLLEKMGYSSGMFEVEHVVRETSVYYAFHTSVSDDLVARFQKALDEVRSSTLYPAILDRYLE